MANRTPGKVEPRCRHRGTWILVGGWLEWCFECGAFRQLEQIGPNSSRAASFWTRPVGIGGQNPALTDGGPRMEQYARMMKARRKGTGK